MIQLGYIDNEAQRSLSGGSNMGLILNTVTRELGDMPPPLHLGATQAQIDQIAARVKEQTERRNVFLEEMVQIIVNALESLAIEDRRKLFDAMLAAGVDLGALTEAGNLVTMGTPAPSSKAGAVLLGLLSTASMAASAYHGYRRNESVGWALVWGFFGAIFPVITPVIAVAQGYGKPKRG